MDNYSEIVLRIEYALLSEMRLFVEIYCMIVFNGRRETPCASKYLSTCYCSNKHRFLLNRVYGLGVKCRPEYLVEIPFITNSYIKILFMQFPLAQTHLHLFKHQILAQQVAQSPGFCQLHRLQME